MTAGDLARAASLAGRRPTDAGIARGRKLVVLVGQKKAMAVRGLRAVRRWSKLGEWLRAPRA